MPCGCARFLNTAYLWICCAYTNLVGTCDRSAQSALARIFTASSAQDHRPGTRIAWLRYVPIVSGEAILQGILVDAGSFGVTFVRNDKVRNLRTSSDTHRYAQLCPFRRPTYKALRFHQNGWRDMCVTFLDL